MSTTDSAILAQASALQEQILETPPYQPLYPYNGTIETGGTSTQFDLNLYYNVRTSSLETWSQRGLSVRGTAQPTAKQHAPQPRALQH